MLFQVLLTLHLLGSSVWVGGHLILAITILPRALRLHDPAIISEFESKYERVGIPALLIQIITGVSLTYFYVNNIFDVFDFAYSQHTLIAIKLLLIVATIAIAAHARLRIISNLKESNLRFLAIHIITITVIAVTTMILGGLVRIGIS